ncbi:hypothetical protein BO94DRAFT_250771 [Aspergillus sclerotioniger CBS 115572]|uniref:Acyl-CoA dehydrogenase/oxidase C-terminal n=1 Tax=Aspergillus sclerotioniger CBS 115572 TaxID=1450535 RepID=A0A317VD18_9EURO|nr:hypothetical protein BO94DRAFT_250771 [Aspergillus sclerotioniger CBS 115572]PWY72156.1 hypothetical protein BO94DRAFT_250771 [Aspergillus sclerotioniger CBS 115572]
MAGQASKPSSSTEGFFQSLPKILPCYNFTAGSKKNHNKSDDVVLGRILELYLPRDCSNVGQSIHNVARRALDPSTLQDSVDAEINQPFLRPLTTFGEENRNDPLWTSAGWKALKAIGQEEGLVSSAYETESASWNRRVHQFALNHVWSGSAAMTGCPASMTDGAAKLLAAHLGDPDGDQPGRSEVMREAYQLLVSRDPRVAWTSGQWMTERTGGSDVRGTETIARRLTQDEVLQGASHDAHGMPLGPWRIDGFKWFSSATDSEMTVMLAQTTKGLSLFYAPMRRRVSACASETELNGIRIQRLKNKLGTKQLPTAELELKGVRGWLIGEEGRGVKEVATILNVTRLYTAAGSTAGWGRGLAICRAYTRARKVQGSLLEENRQHVRWMADETVKYWAAMHWTFFGIALQGSIEQDWNLMVRNTKATPLIPRDKKQAATLLRLITPALKALVSVESVHGLRACMEGLGGVGYCENNEDGGILNIARIFRDTLVNPIWEGTVSVMAEDVVRVITDRRLGDGRVLENILGQWTRNVLQFCQRLPDECVLVHKRLERFIQATEKAEKAELLWRGRGILSHVQAIVCSSLLMYDACVDGDEVALTVASRYVRSHAGYDTQSPSQWHSESLKDKKVFLGAGNIATGKL